jgi:hypothetical protein
MFQVGGTGTEGRKEGRKEIGPCILMFMLAAAVQENMNSVSH